MTQKYEIRVYYTESDSESDAEDHSATIAFTWENLVIAKIALQTIREHYDFMQRYNSYGEYRWKPVDCNKTLEEAKTRPWFVGGPRGSEWEQRLLLLQDDGTWKQTSTYWCGYFETLTGADIVPSDNEMSFRL